MDNLIRKLTSRKFLLALVGVVSGLAMAFGVTGEEVNRVVSVIGGLLTTLGSIAAYSIAEAEVDAAREINGEKEDE